jgi:hypothetical protein
LSFFSCDAMNRSICFLACSILLIPAAARAVTFGWQELPDGGIEYLVQVEPDLLDSFRKEGFASDIPKGLRDIRRIQIVVGVGQLPHQGDVNGPQPAAVEQPVEHKATDSVPPLLPQQASSDPSSSSQTSADPAVPDRGATDKGASAVAEAARDFTQPLPFFQSGSAKHIHPMEAMPGEASSGSADASAGSRASPASAAVETAEQPRLNNGEGGVSAGYGSAPDGQGDTMTGAPKPWLPLMGALLCLFASLAANVYLVWIHVAVRAKYRTLVRAGAAASG